MAVWAWRMILPHGGPLASFRDEAAEGCSLERFLARFGEYGSRLREKPRVSDDKTVANMGHPILFFFDDEVGGGGVGGELDPVGDVGSDVGDFAGVEDYFFASFYAGPRVSPGAVVCPSCMVPPVTRVMVPLVMIIWSAQSWWSSASPVWTRTTRRVL